MYYYFTSSPINMFTNSKLGKKWNPRKKDYLELFLAHVIIWKLLILEFCSEQNKQIQIVCFGLNCFGESKSIFCLLESIPLTLPFRCALLIWFLSTYIQLNKKCYSFCCKHSCQPFASLWAQKKVSYYIKCVNLEM